MSAPRLECSHDGRRARVRGAGLNGLDYVEVSDDQLVIEVRFLAKAPEPIGPDNVRIDGGERITGIRVVSVDLCREEDPELDDCMRVTVDRPGDFSTYVLRVVEPDPGGGPGHKPLAGFDPRYASVEFSFKAGCQSGLDCAPADDCPPPTYDEPEISYLARGYASFRGLILDRLALVMPQWTERHAPDVMMAAIEAIAYAGDQLAYFEDAVATEAYLDTARRRTSVRRHARLVDYLLHDGCNARAWVCFEVSEDLDLARDDFVCVAAAGTPVALPAQEADRRLLAAPVFAPLAAGDVRLRAAHNTIELWTWGDRECCLPSGTTRATLVDAGIELEPGDVLVFEELLGPRTGNPADADPAHRQAVRLTEVVPGTDDLFDQAIVEVAWDDEDALRFPLCVSSTGGEDCRPLAPVSVARGNVVLVDHGLPVDFCGEGEPIDVPPARLGEPECDCECVPAERAEQPTPFSPRLAYGPVTQAAPMPAPSAVARAQARIAGGLVDAVELWLRELAERLEADGAEPGDEEFEQLCVIFGARALAAAGLAPRGEHGERGRAPARDVAAGDALEQLLAREHGLLGAKYERTRALARRAAAGELLPEERVGELVGLWGERFAGALRPASSALWGPAASALAQDPRAALPAVELSDPPDPDPHAGPAARAADVPWAPRRDLLATDARERHFVGEVDDDGAMQLRFGYGTAAAVPAPGARLVVSYRVGNGSAGNVAAEAIARVLLCTTRTDAIVRVRNPLPAEGGVDPEPVALAKQLAPGAFRRRLARAVTADDYATLAGEQPGVQRAVARLRWTGSWYEAAVGVDPLGTDQPDPRLLTAVEDRLAPARRIGHDLAVRRAQYVPLDVVLGVCVLAGFERAQVRARLAEALGPRGLFAPDALTFGSGVAVSAVIAAAQAVAGVESVIVGRVARLFESGSEAIETGVLPLGPTEIPQLDNDPSFPERGRLTLFLRGGR